jgi:hypothetical protein
MCDECDKLTRQEQIDRVTAFERAICANGGQIVQMSAWLSRLERWFIGHGNKHYRKGNHRRAEAWWTGRSLVYLVDDGLRTLGLAEG